jgi:uncharacterized membrane protein YfcA
VVGGGGLVQLPVLLLVPGLSPVQALATNKLGGFLGTTTSAVTFYRRVRPDLRTALPMAGLALVASAGGASIAALLPTAVFKPVIVVALVAIGAFTLLRPALGEVTALRHTGRRHHAVAASAKAKIVNCATNLGALLFFVPHGSVFWGLGLLLGLANMAGSYLGARTATTRGSRFIRVVFLVVVTVLIARLGWDVWTEELRPRL